MTQRDSVPDDLRAWRAAGVPLDAIRQDACRAPVVAAIERAMGRERRHHVRKRWLRRALVAAALVAGGVGAVMVVGDHSAEQPESAEVAVAEAWARATRGSAEVSRGGETLRLADQHPVSVVAGDSIQVGARASLVVDLPNTGTMEWGEGAELEVREVASNTQDFALRRGHVAVTIPPDAPARRLIVSTPHVEVIVVGTVFDVDVSTQEGEVVTEVRVTRGVVELVHRGETIRRLRAGDSWSSRVPRDPKEAQRNEPKDEPAPQVKRPPTRSKATGPNLAKQNQLYRAALDARNAGNDVLAVELLSQLLAKYPNATLAQDAKVERLRALRRLGRDREATEAARRYLAEHGDGFARNEARNAAFPEKKAPEKK